KWADWPKDYPQGGLLFHGDNKEVLAHLLANGFRGKVKLIYIDPPFDSGADYVRKISLRGMNSTSKLDGEAYTLGEQIQYTDIWTNDSYLQFMFERLLLLRELLSEEGAIYLHCDWHKSHHLRCLMDEIFGPTMIRNEIVWKRTSARSDSHTFNHIHDLLLFYTKADQFRFNQLYVEHDPTYIERYYIYQEPDGRRFATIDATQSGLTKEGESGKPWRGFDPASKGNHWKFAVQELDRLDRVGRIYWPEKSGGWPRLKSYLDELKGAAIQSIWTDLKAVNSQATERGDYPTQKPESLVERIISASSDPGDVVLDCFIGSGTTAAVAQKLGRRWIGCDINKGAIQTTSKRLQGIILEQIEMQKKDTKQQKLDFKEGDKNNKEPVPAQLSFQVYRVNDYDLQIQHNEAVNLACEHIGVQRTHNDAFFDGVQGKRLVKIVPFNHPLSPLDLEQIKNELKVRPDENRDVLVVALGKELALDAWLEEWNRLRRKGDVPNKIEVIELRTDPKYGKFIEHKPATARIKIARKDGKILVEITDFISPTIIERLSQQNGVVQPQVKDWRSMVDCVMIDPAYDSKVFNVALSDVPEKKDDFVNGKYELPVDTPKNTVAVKIVDMLGEEVVEVKEV
ncbi:MAG: site-specific DNA-methyltransferase, partial [Bacteroidetes bacterium]|nr:site-specific DNA-methyltransferase [Bacteroidota bacterium]